LAALIAGASITSVTAAQTYGFGQPATAVEIAGWDIDVRPDGTGRPAGWGSVTAGQPISICNGPPYFGLGYSVTAPAAWGLASDQPVRTTGSKLNYATTLWTTSIAPCLSRHRRR
jgi:cytochrome c